MLADNISDRRCQRRVEDMTVVLFAAYKAVEDLAEVRVDGCSPGAVDQIFFLGALFNDIDTVAALAHDVGFDVGGYPVEEGLFPID